MSSSKSKYLLAAGVFAVLMVAFLLLAMQAETSSFAYVAWPLVFVCLFTALRLAKKSTIRGGEVGERPTTFGSAQWATMEDFEKLKRQKLLGGSDGLALGMGLHREWCKGGIKEEAVPLFYTGKRHLLTVAPTRGGKGVSAIIPNLLNYEGSVLVIDPKGENARITAARRGAGDVGRKIAGMGQKVYVVDPWGSTGLPVACFNPLDWLDAYDPDIGENADMLADSLVISRSGGNGASEFFDSEAKALLRGILLYVATEPAEQENRTLGRVRDILVMGKTDLAAIFERMYESANRVVASTAARHAAKESELASNVMASLQSHTHFLDTDRVRESLSRSDFRFQDMKHTPMSVYLVLPADRLDEFGRWLRLLVQQAITMNARNIEREPAKPILFLLDEMAALGHLKAVERAFGLMAGFGMQLWGIVQDLSQLERIYDKGWQTFISNCGVLQYLGSRDQKTAKYFSELCGMTTVPKTSLSRSVSQATSGGNSTSGQNDDHIGRWLATPDELMVLAEHNLLLIVENCNPISGTRIVWFNDPWLKTLGVNLHDENQRRLSAVR